MTVRSKHPVQFVDPDLNEPTLYTKFLRIVSFFLILTVILGVGYVLYGFVFGVDNTDDDSGNVLEVIYEKDYIFVKHSFDSRADVATLKIYGSDGGTMDRGGGLYELYSGEYHDDFDYTFDVSKSYFYKYFVSFAVQDGHNTTTHWYFLLRDALGNTNVKKL
jgi:hypothetical protein